MDEAWVRWNVDVEPDEDVIVIADADLFPDVWQELSNR
jgi:hypothetical protein